MAIHHDKLAYGKLASSREDVSQSRMLDMLSKLNEEIESEICDLHLHTYFSLDSEENPEKYITKAITLNQRYIGFSDHYDYDCVLWNMNVSLPDLTERRQTLNLLKQKFDKITVLIGLELGYAKEAEAHYKQLISKGDYDYIINSVHGLKGRGDCYFAEFFKDKQKKEAYADYLNAVYQSVNADFKYDIVGHIGYVARNAPYDDKRLLYSDFSYEIDKILKSIIDRGVSLEINGSVGNNSAMFTPDTDIIARYVQLGGQNLTYGSDAHRIDSYFRNAENVKRFLKEIGVDKLSVYVNGEKRSINI